MIHSAPLGAASVRPQRASARAPALVGPADDDGARRRDRDGPVSRQRPVGQRGRAGRHPVVCDRGRHLAAPRTRTDRDGGGPSNGGRLRRVRGDVHLALRRLRGARELLADAGDRDRRATGRRVDLHGLLVSGSAWRRVGARVRRGARLHQLARGRPPGHDRVLARHDQGRRGGAVCRTRRAGRVRLDRRARDRPATTSPDRAASCPSASPACGSAAVS